MLELVPHTDPILWTKTEKFDFSDWPMNPVELYNQLAKLMIDSNGLGLAAPQVGLPYRFFVVASDPVMGVFNPIVVDTSSEQTNLDEACLSWPGLSLKIKRARRIRLRFTEPNGNIRTEIFNDLSAKVVQHEMEHLEGQFFGASASRIQQEMAIKRAAKLGYTYTMADILGKSTSND